jgi:peptidoglycan/xylan/chitin deacetylase (PgdA/CDA1 family)
LGAPQAVSALAYHKVAEIPPTAKYRCNYITPARFDAQLRCLQMAGYSSISFRDYLAYRRGERRLPHRAVLITFDDGYKSNLEIAVPMLRRRGFTATFFVVAGLLGGTNAWDEDELQEPLLSEADVRSMHALGFEIQSHTLTHPHLTRLSPFDLSHELGDSRRLLEGILDAPVDVIAYPWSEHDADVRQAAADAGYDAGVVLRRRTNFSDTPRFELRRIGINDETSLLRFAWDLARLRHRGA